MEQTKKGPGRPRKAPVEKVVASEPAKKRTVKRTQRDDSKLPKLYETVGRQGGVFLKFELTTFRSSTKRRTSLEVFATAPQNLASTSTSKARKRFALTCTSLTRC